MIEVPLVSVVTPTWRRNDILIDRCIPSVAEQTYPNVEHVVVSDGPDPALAERLTGTDVVFHQIPTHDASVRFGHWARLEGIARSTGAFIAYLDDDNAYRPDHLDLLIRALTTDRCAAFAYSRILVHANPSYVVGATPPAFTQVDTSSILHRRELLAVATWHEWEAPDWDLVNDWVTAGVRWRFIDEVTADYFLDCKQP